MSEFKRLQIAIVLCSVMLSGMVSAGFAADWGTVKIDIKGDRINDNVLFENSLLRMRYSSFNEVGGKGSTQDNGTVIKLFVLKTDPDLRNMAGDYTDSVAHSSRFTYLDACAWRYYIKSATVTSDDGESIATNMVWEKGSQANITLYKDQPFVKIDYVSNGVNAIDIGVGNDTYVCYNSDKWKRPLTTGLTYSAYIAQGENKDVLKYNGYLIFGMYDSETGIGYGRVMSANLSHVMFLSFCEDWTCNGYEFFPGKYTGFLYLVSKGEDEIISLGKGLIDWINGGEMPEPPQAVLVPRAARASRARIDDGAVLSAAQRAGGIRVRVRSGLPHTVRVCTANGSVVMAREGNGEREYMLPRSAAPRGTYVISARVGEITHTQSVVVVGD